MFQDVTIKIKLLFSFTEKNNYRPNGYESRKFT